MNNKRLESFFLPDLCNVRAVLILILLCESLVLALVLVEAGLPGFQWQKFAMLSYFIQWLTLVSVALLCLSRRFMAQMKLSLAVIWAMSLILIVCGSMSFVAVYFMPAMGYQNDDGWWWVVRNMLLGAIFGGMALRYFYMQSQWRLQTQAELNARLQALQARIRPHFFFNSLNTVASLIMVDPEKAEHMLLDLSSLFRVVLKDQDAHVGINKELELGRRYLNIEQQRLGSRLKISWQLPNQIPSIQVPQLLLQPLLENAIYHGIQPLMSGGEITISLSLADGSENGNESNGLWVLEVKNDKPVDAVESKGHQMALPNIAMRLEAVFENKASLKSEQSDHVYRVMITLPE